MPDDSSNPSVGERVYECAVAFQKAYAAYHGANATMKGHFHDAYQHTCEALWNALKPDLMNSLNYEFQRQTGHEPETLALNLFTAITIALPTLELDPHRNVRHLLLKIAYFRQIDELRTMNARTRQRDTGGQTATTNGQMWYPAESGQRRTNANLDLVDNRSFDTEDRVIASIDREHLFRYLWAYWYRRLPDLDYQIMRIRWSNTPPVSFGDIAQTLGRGWEEATVRQRHHRVMKETRQHLEQQGWLSF